MEREGKTKSVFAMKEKSDQRWAGWNEELRRQEMSYTEAFITELNIEGISTSNIHK